MDTTRSCVPDVPVICVDEHGWSAFEIFNPNIWSGDSRAIVQSCASEFAVLLYTVARIRFICGSADLFCQPYVESLRQRWLGASWDLSRGMYFGQVPELHVLIEGYFAGLKSLLDLLVQLLATEKIVGVAVDGFHRANGIYGGAVLNVLERNIKKGRETPAAVIRELLLGHKELWIDRIIQSRDLLVHPAHGMHQLMFELLLTSRDNELIYHGARPPHVGETAIDSFADQGIGNARSLATAFLGALSQAA